MGQLGMTLPSERCHLSCSDAEHTILNTVNLNMLEVTIHLENPATQPCSTRGGWGEPQYIVVESSPAVCLAEALQKAGTRTVVATKLGWWISKVCMPWWRETGAARWGIEGRCFSFQAIGQ
jgi:hypothetical protein